MIFVSFSLCDPKKNYSKYTAVAIASMLEKTSSDIEIHLLVDDTVDEERKEMFRQLVEGWGQRIFFHNITIPPELGELEYIGGITTGTLFRLKIIDVLPEYINKIIYLDSDIMINMDINELWMEDMGNNLVCGRHDLYWDNPLYDEGVSSKTYINAGVLLLNVAGIRLKHDLFSEALLFFKSHKNCRFLDQDAINFIFNDSKGFIDEKYNRFVKYCEKDELNYLVPCLYHFVRRFPQKDGETLFDRLFFKILVNTPWSNEIITEYSLSIGSYEEKLRSIAQISYMIGCSRTLIFWGAKETRDYCAIKKIYDLHKKEIFFIDINEELKGTYVDGYEVRTVSSIQQMNDVYIIVLATNHYAEIKAELDKMGYTEKKHFANSRMCIPEGEKI